MQYAVPWEEIAAELFQSWAKVKVRYSTSVYDRPTTFCLLDDQETRLVPKNIQSAPIRVRETN